MAHWLCVANTFYFCRFVSISFFLNKTKMFFQDPHVESYSISDITSELGLTRERLVALALLLGCDYYPAGVPGVGEAWAVKLMASLATVDVLKRYAVLCVFEQKSVC